MLSILLVIPLKEVAAVKHPVHSLLASVTVSPICLHMTALFRIGGRKSTTKSLGYAYVRILQLQSTSFNLRSLPLLLLQSRHQYCWFL